MGRGAHLEHSRAPGKEVMWIDNLGTHPTTFTNTAKGCLAIQVIPCLPVSSSSSSSLLLVFTSRYQRSRSHPQDKMSATFFWPGSEADIGGQHPTYWFPYSDDTLFSERVEQVGRRSGSSRICLFSFSIVATHKRSRTHTYLTYIRTRK